jgi:GMP synthase (glutamine-hydrolysing)
VVITGSAANVTDEPFWLEDAVQWVRKALLAQIPLFGICFGHQLMAHALGGQVNYHPGGRESGSHPIRLTSEGRRATVLTGAPPQFDVQLIHEQTVIEAPSEASVLACNDHDSFQILGYGERALSVQFHPEFDAATMATYLDVMRPTLHEEGTDVDTLIGRITPTPLSSDLIRRFFAPSRGQ